MPSPEGLQIAYVNNDNLLDVRGLKIDHVQSGAPVNVASVTATLVLSGTSTEVSGPITWPLGLSLVSSGSGSGEDVTVGARWQGVLPDSLQLTADEYYQAQLNVFVSDGFEGYWEVPLRAKVREG